MKSILENLNKVVFHKPSNKFYRVISINPLCFSLIENNEDTHLVKYLFDFDIKEFYSTKRRKLNTCEMKNLIGTTIYIKNICWLNDGYYLVTSYIPDDDVIRIYNCKITSDELMNKLDIFKYEPLEILENE